MITKLAVHNFKSWGSTGEVRLAPITGFFGSNSSGKTSLLQLLLMLKQTTESADRTQVLNLGDDRSLVELGTFKDIIYNHQKNESLKWELDWELKENLKIPDPEQRGKTLFDGKSLKFKAEINENGAGRMAVNKLTYNFSAHDFIMKRKTKDKNQYDLSSEASSSAHHFKFKRSMGRAWELPTPVKCYGFPDQVKAYYQNAGFLSDFVLAFEKLFSEIYYLGPLREYPRRQYTWAGAQPADMGRRGEKVIDAILASREKKEVISRGKGLRRFTAEQYVAYWLRELKMIHDFKVEPITKESNLYRVWVRKTENSANVLITDVGFGVSQILPVITLCYYVPEGSTILMEQPEIHLHPSVQAGLADVFIDAVKTRKIQIILESHSEYLLKRLQRRIAEEQITSTDAALYFCDMVNGGSKMTELNLDLFGNITNWPEGFFGDDFGEMAAMTQAILQRQKMGQP
jgi:predicted ATPase